MIKKFDLNDIDRYNKTRYVDNLSCIVNEIINAVNALEEKKPHEFKKGDKVLVRNGFNDVWQPKIYECMYGTEYKIDTGLIWKYCIPFDIDKWGTV